MFGKYQRCKIHVNFAGTGSSGRGFSDGIKISPYALSPYDYSVALIIRLACIHYFRTWSQHGQKCHRLCPEIYLTVFCHQDFFHQSMLCFVHFILLLQSTSDSSCSCSMSQSCKIRVVECFFPIFMSGSLFGIASFSDPICWCCWQFSSVYLLSAYHSPMEGNWLFSLFSILWRR